MANIYVRSTDGSDADNGTTWALAKATLAGAGAIDAAGDNIYVSQAHAESTASAITVALAGTAASPVNVVGASDSAAPPTAVSTAPTITTTGDVATGVTGYAYVYGLNFVCGSGSAGSSVNLNLNTTVAGVFQQYENCNLTLAGTGTAPRVQCGFAGLGDITNTKLKNCGFKFGNVNQRIRINGFVHIQGGSILSGGSAISATLIDSAATNRQWGVLIEGFDASNMATTCPIMSGSSSSVGDVILRNCKLPSSWTGTLINGTITDSATSIQAYNCDSGDTNYRYWAEKYTGTIRDETVIVRSGGASDGTTAISHKMDSNTLAKYPPLPLESPEIVRWNDTVGSAITVTVEVVHDTNVAAGQGAGTSFAFRDDEIWLSVQYMGTSGFPLGAFINDGVATVLTAPADQASSSVSWTTTGLTTPVKQALSVTFTPQEKGFLLAKVVIAKASKTLYVDPKLEIT